MGSKTRRKDKKKKSKTFSGVTAWAKKTKMMTLVHSHQQAHVIRIR
jgi:hypothetical protein